MAVVEGRAAPVTAQMPEEVDAEAAPDVEALSREQIRQFVSRRFAGHELARLVGAVLSAQGFEESVSPPGADRGVDILAGWGPLGLDSPRLAVQVKTGTAGVDEFRALRGVMEDFRADQGLLVAWGGFTGTVRTEARHAHFSIRLWDADDLLDELFERYENLSGDVRSELPLLRVFALAVPEPGDA